MQLLLMVFVALTPADKEQMQVWYYFLNQKMHAMKDSHIREVKL